MMQLRKKTLIECPSSFFSSAQIRPAATITGWFWEPAADPAQPPVLRRWAVYPLLALVIIALGIAFIVRRRARRGIGTSL